MIVNVGDEKMEALFTIVLKRFGRFYVKQGTTLLSKGKGGGDICEIGHRKKGKENWQILELTQLYHYDKSVCIRSIIRIEFNPLTKKYIVKLRKKQIAKGIASRIAGPGEDDRFPELKYYALVRERR